MNSSPSIPMSVQAPSTTLADLTLKGLKHRDQWMQAKNQMLGLDFEQIEKPEVQRILRALGVAPKPREWLFDRGLKKVVANHLMTHAVLLDSIQSYLLEVIMKFWHRLELSSNAYTRGLLRTQSRTFHAVLARNHQIEKIIKDQHDHDLQNYVDYQQAVLHELIRQQHELESFMRYMIEEVARGFVVFAREDKVLREIFDGVEDEKVEQFADLYLHKRVKHEIIQAQLVVDCEEAVCDLAHDEDKPSKAEPEIQDPESEAQDHRFQVLHNKLNQALDILRGASNQEKQRVHNLEKLRQRLNKEQRYIRLLPQKVAKQCELEDSQCMRIAQHESYVNSTLGSYCQPHLQPLMTIRQEWLRNQTCQAHITEHLKPIERKLALQPFLITRKLTPSAESYDFVSENSLKFPR